MRTITKVLSQLNQHSPRSMTLDLRSLLTRSIIGQAHIISYLLIGRWLWRIHCFLQSTKILFVTINTDVFLTMWSRLIAVLGERLGGHIRVNGDTAVYKGSFPEGIPGANNHSKLHEATQEFAGRFSYRPFQDLDPNQMEFLDDKANGAVYRPLNENEHRVIAKANEMVELKRKLFSQSRSGHPPLARRNSVLTRRPNDTCVLI